MENRENRFRWTGVVLFCSATLGGCAAGLPPIVKPYAPKVTMSALTRDQTFEGAIRAVEGLEPTRLLVDRSGYRISAFVGEADSLRDRIDIEITPKSEVIVRAKTQREAAPGVWMSPSVVCSSYAYAREEQLTEEILHRP